MIEKVGFYNHTFFYHLESFKPDEDGIAMLQSMGFSRSQCVLALKNTDNNIERAADWIFSHPDEINSEEYPTSSNAPLVQALPESQFVDGCPGKYVNSFVELINLRYSGEFLIRIFSDLQNQSTN